MKKDLKDFVYVFEATAGELAMLVGPLDENLRQIETAFDAMFCKLLGNELGVEIEEPLDVYDARRLEGQPVVALRGQVAVYGEPCGFSLSHRGNPEVVAVAVADDLDACAAQQCRNLTCQTGAVFGADY